MPAAAPFHTPYFSGTTTTSNEVPARYHVAIGGRAYLLDIASNEWRHQSVPLLRQQADQSDTPGQTSLNPEGLWRRALDTYHLGAGQTHRDRPESSDFRFRDSKGVNVWNRWQLSLLPDTDEKRASANTNLLLATAGARVFLLDGTACIYTDNITAGTPTWTAVTSPPGGALTGMTCDGTHVYVTDGTNLYRFSSSGSPAFGAAWNTLDCDLLAYVKGRVMAANDHEIFNVTSTTPPTALMTHPNTDFRWVGFAEGLNVIYAAGFAGDKSEVYRTAVAETGGSLDVPIIAGRLPDGEIVRSIVGYLGMILIGTDRGVRFASPSADGDLTIGALLETGSACRCFEAQGPYVWFGWDNYDSISTGLGRVSLESFAVEDALAPAYASDLMATDQGSVLSVLTSANVRVFSVSGQGVFAEDTVLVSVGSLRSGHIDFGITDDKVAVEIAEHHEDNAGSHSVALATEGEAFETIGTHTVGAEDPFVVTSLTRGRSYELELTMTRDTIDSTTGPIINGVTLLVQPAPEATTLIRCPILLHAVDDLPNGSTAMRDPSFELEYLIGLHDSRFVVSYQEGTASHTVIVDDYEWRPHHFNSGVPEGTCILTMKVV